MDRTRFFAAAAAFALGVTLSKHVGPLSTAPLPFLFAAVITASFARYRVALLLTIALLGGARAAADRAQPLASEQPATWHRGTVDSLVAEQNGVVRFALDDGDRRLEVIATRDLTETGRPGAPHALPLPGDVVVVWGRVTSAPTYWGWGVDDGRAMLRAHGHVGRLIAGLDRVQVVRAGTFGVRRAAARAHRSLSRRVAERGGHPEGNAVVRALVAGDRSAITPELATTLRRAGIGHLLAVSGLHLAVVTAFIFLVVRRLWTLHPTLAGRVEPITVAAVLALLGATAYALVTGARPSAMRALLVAIIVLGHLAWFRRVEPLDALGAAATLLLVWRPAMIVDPSFQMSFAAAITLCIAHRQRRASSRWRRLALAIWTLGAVSAWALLATTPTSSAIFGEVAPVGLLVNMVALPLVELLVLPLALLGALLSLLTSTGGGFLIDISVASAGALIELAAWVSHHVSPYSLPPLTAGESLGVFATMGALLARRGTWGALVAMTLAALVAASIVWPRDAPSGLRVTFLDVGQGDAAVIEFPTGDVWLIDAGGRPRSRRPEAPGRIAVLGYLRARRIRRINVAVVSHAHPDHYLGLGAVAGEVAIQEMWVATADPDQPRPASLDALARWGRVMGTEVKTPPRFVRVGDTSVTVLAPRGVDGGIAVDPVSSVNDNSIVMRFDFAERSVLVAGDLEEEGESLLLERGADLRADVVKVSHHGSRTSSKRTWVQATGARYAVVSCGRGNRFGFPHPDVVARWQAAGARVLRTDRLGAVSLLLKPDGSIEVSSVRD